MGSVVHPAQIGQFFNVVATGFAAILYSSNFNSQEGWSHVRRIICFSALLTSLILLLKLWTKLMYDRKDGIKTKERCGRDYAIGSVLTIILTSISFYNIFSSDISDSTRAVIFFTCNISSFVLYLAFIWDVENWYLVKGSWRTAYMALVLMLVLYFALLDSMDYSSLFHHGFIVSLVVFQNFNLVWHQNITILLEMVTGEMVPLRDENGEIIEEMREMRSMEDQREGIHPIKKKSEGTIGNGIKCFTVVETSQPDTKSLFSFRIDGTDCDICYTKFDESVNKQIPRILVACGHTVCEGCVDNLLKHNGNHVSCPFCQQVTVVHGGSKRLPKNYGMLKFIR